MSKDLSSQIAKPYFDLHLALNIVCDPILSMHIQLYIDKFNTKKPVRRWRQTSETYDVAHCEKMSKEYGKTLGEIYQSDAL